MNAVDQTTEQSFDIKFINLAPNFRKFHIFYSRHKLLIASFLFPFQLVDCD